MKADHIAEERSCKWDTIGVKGVSNIDMIFALLEDFFGDLRVQNDWLQLAGTTLYRNFSLVRLAEAIVRAEPYVLFAGKVFYSKKSSRVSGSLNPTKRGGIIMQEREPDAIAERGLALSNWAFPNGLANPLGLE